MNNDTITKETNGKSHKLNDLILNALGEKEQEFQTAFDEIIDSYSTICLEKGSVNQVINALDFLYNYLPKGIDSLSLVGEETDRTSFRIFYTGSEGRILRERYGSEKLLRKYMLKSSFVARCENGSSKIKERDTDGNSYLSMLLEMRDIHLGNRVRNNQDEFGRTLSRDLRSGLSKSFGFCSTKIREKYVNTPILERVSLIAFLDGPLRGLLDTWQFHEPFRPYNF